MRAKKTYLETIREEKKLRREKEALARAKKRAKELEANPQITGHRREMVALRRRLYKKGAKFLYEDGVLPRIVNTIEITKNVVDSETFKDNIFKTTETVLDSLLYTHIPPVLAEVLKKNGMFGPDGKVLMPRDLAKLLNPDFKDFNNNKLSARYTMMRAIRDYLRLHVEKTVSKLVDDHNAIKGRGEEDLPEDD